MQHDPQFHQRANFRQRRYWSRLKQAAAGAGADTDAVAAAQAQLIQQCRDYPAWTAPWLVDRLGRNAAIAFRDALTRVLDTVPKEDAER